MKPINKYLHALILVPVLLLAACSENSSNAKPVVGPVVVNPDFTAADAWLEEFVATQELFPGGSMIIVDKEQGTIHKSAFGNQTEDSVVLVASLSKVPAVTLLMALDEDDSNVNFDIQEPITSYLPWMGVWDPAITTEHLVSNRSGIPGLVYVFIQPANYSPHFCQFSPLGNLQGCAQTLFSTALPALPSTPANTAFDYGGGQWQISGAVAELVGGGTWNQLWNQYIAEPCGIEVARYGNLLAAPASWDGNPDSLVGIENANIEGGMISNLDDYARIISLHLNGGACGDKQVLSSEAVAFMREARTAAIGSGPGAIGSPPDWGYAMGWWILPPTEGGSVYLYLDPGAYGSVAWIDVKREYGGVVFFEEYTQTAGGVGSGAVITQLIPIIEEALDAVR